MSQESIARASNQPSERQRTRASIACHRCHAKKVRCNATERSACSGCIAKGVQCVLIDSQRGRYARKGVSSSQKEPSSRNSATARRQHNAETTTPAPPANRTWAHDASAPQNDSPSLRNDGTPHSNRIALPTTPSAEAGAASLYAEIAERSVDAQEIPIRNIGGSVFLGETFSLTYVVHDVLAPFLSNAPGYRRRLHFPIADASNAMPLHLTAAAQTNILRDHDIYYCPPDALAEELRRLYFEYFHPAFPIVEEASFRDIAVARTQSQLVWNAILMLAVTLCDDEMLQASGFADRHAARSVFYNQTRCLYNGDAEPDCLNNIRGVFLMSFYWGGPHDQKDSKYWMGIAISLAQSQGLHRTTKNSNIEISQAQMWKRIWWSLRTRDVLISASIGRPQFASERDCDVELPTALDLGDELQGTDSEASSYFVQMAKLSVLVSRIIDTRYTPSSPIPTRNILANLEEEMSQLAREIPHELQYIGVEAHSGKGFWSAMLVMAHGYANILLCRPARTTGNEFLGNNAKAVEAATSISRATEDILSSSKVIRLCQVHMIAALFNALAVSVYTICTSHALGKGLAETRARVCMMGLAALQESWPVSGWVLKLFETVMARLKKPAHERIGPPRNGTHERTQASSRAVTERPEGNDTGYNGAVDHTNGVMGDIGGNMQQHWPTDTDYYEAIPSMFIPDDALSSFDTAEASFFDWLGFPPLADGGYTWSNGYG